MAEAAARFCLHRMASSGVREKDNVAWFSAMGASCSSLLSRSRFSTGAVPARDRRRLRAVLSRFLERGEAGTAAPKSCERLSREYAGGHLRSIFTVDKRRFIDNARCAFHEAQSCNYAIKNELGGDQPDKA